MNLKENSFYFLRKATVFSGFFFALACQSQAPRPGIALSSIDSHYRLQKKSADNSEISPSIRFYRGVISKTLASQCKWFPTDSSYTNLVQNKCGVISGTIQGFSRFMKEEDAARMGYPLVPVNNHLHFVDIPNECSL